MSLKRALPHVVMAVVLLVAQQAGYEHALSHFEQSSPASKEKQLPHTKACDRCGLSAQLGTGLLSNPALFISAARSACGALLLSRAFHPTAPRRFLSRAPPASI
jgi:hypothetical protein